MNKKIKNFFRAITVEPAVLTFAVSQGLYLIVSAELYITKVCKVNLAYGEDICNNIQHHRDEQAEVQKYVSTLRIYNSILQAIPSVIFALFAGPWSDTNGRKFLIVSALFGFVFNNGVFMINTYWFYELKAEYLLFECLQDCTGGFSCFFLGISAYMADITTEKNRTRRMAFMSGLWPVGFNVGKVLGGIIKANLGFMYNFAIGMMLSMFAMLYVVIFVKDSRTVQDRLKVEKEEKEEMEETGTVVEKEKVTTVHKTMDIKALFDLNNVKQGFRALTKKRDHNMRRYLFLIIFCCLMEMFLNVGKWSTDYLYLRRKLQFTMGDYTRYSTVVGVIGITAQYITVPFMSGKLGFRDSTIVMVDMAGCFFQAIIMAVVTAEWMLYVGASIAFLDSTSGTMLRCMTSKSVGQDELGKVLSVATAMQAFIPIISSPIFGSLYRATVTTLPQTYCIVLACCFAINCLVLFYIDRGMKRIGVEKKELLQREMEEMESKEVKEALVEKS